MFTSQKMPAVDTTTLNKELSKLSKEEQDIIKLVVKKDNTIRATKPKVNEKNPVTGKAAYVWRMVCFVVSPKPTHQCMPSCADFDLPAYKDDGTWSSTGAMTMAKELKVIEDVIINAIPRENWHSAERWARAFGI